MNTLVEETNVKFDHLRTQGVDDHASLEDRIMLNMILATRHLFKSKNYEKYIGIAVRLNKKDGTQDVAHLNLLSEIFRKFTPLEFIDEVVRPQSKKIPRFLEREQHLTTEDIDSADIKIFTFTEDELNAAIKREFSQEEKR